MDFNEKRKEMIETIKAWGIKDEKILKVMSETKREKFVPEDYKEISYENRPLPIGEDQTISQPYTIAFMLEALELSEKDVVLEIGTGSGYNAALLSRLAKEVITTEIIKSLALKARRKLRGCKNVKVMNVDIPEIKGKFDKIIVTAACPVKPKVLLEKLKDNGLFVAPIGISSFQNLIKIRKTKKGYEEENLGSFIFVPLRGRFGY